MAPPFPPTSLLVRRPARRKADGCGWLCRRDWPDRHPPEGRPLPHRSILTLDKVEIRSRLKTPVDHLKGRLGGLCVEPFSQGETCLSLGFFLHIREALLHESGVGALK